MENLKQYTGTKTIKAFPMDEETAIINKFAHPNPDHESNRPGYLVIYEDGYHSWSPKDAFEKAYKLTETYIQRMVLEYEELSQRIEGAQQFVDFNPKFLHLPNIEQECLKGQISAMKSYQFILGQRIELALEREEREANNETIYYKTAKEE